MWLISVVLVTRAVHSMVVSSLIPSSHGILQPQAACATQSCDCSFISCDHSSIALNHVIQARVTYIIACHHMCCHGITVCDHMLSYIVESIGMVLPCQCHGASVSCSAI